MEFEIQKKQGHTLITVHAERLDANNTNSLKSQILYINSEGEKNIILDMAGCSYCDSSGLRAVLVANRMCEEAIGTFILSGLQPDVDNLIRLSMLHTVLLITKTVEEAKELLMKKEDM